MWQVKIIQISVTVMKQPWYLLTDFLLLELKKFLYRIELFDWLQKYFCHKESEWTCNFIKLIEVYTLFSLFNFIFIILYFFHNKVKNLFSWNTKNNFQFYSYFFKYLVYISIMILNLAKQKKNTAIPSPVLLLHKCNKKK